MKTNFIFLIKDKRVKLGLTQVGLSRKCNLSKNMIFQYENGVEPTLTRALVILKELNLSTKDLKVD